MGGRRTDFDALVDQEIQQAAQGAESTQLEWAQIKKRLLALRAELLPTQLAFLTDPSKRKAVVTTRRSGKTYNNRQCAAEAVVDNPWRDQRKSQPVVQYIAQTQKKCLDNFWTPFKLLCERIGMKGHFDDANLRATFPNGVLVRCAGLDTSFEVDKFRGDAYVLVIIDEAATFGPKVEELVIAGVGMAMADYDGTMIMTGTPGQAQVGYFYEIYCKARPEWSVHPCWSFMDNYHLPANVRTEAWILANLGPLDSPKVRREAYGEWVSDASTLVYQYTDSGNLWDGALPAGHDWSYILGLDVGYRDPTAFVVGAFAKTHPWLFIVHSESHAHMLPAEVEEHIGVLKARYNIRRIVMDTGGSMALSNMNEWNMRSNFGIIGAQKKDKLTYIEHMNSDFHMGKIKVLKGLSVVKEWKTLPWADAEDEVRDARHDGKSIEHKGFPNHECDAALYMWRESRHYRSKEPEAPPEPNTPDYWRKQQLHAKTKALQTAVRNAQGNGFRYGRIKQH